MDANVLQPLAFEREDDVLILHLLWPAETGELVRRPRLDELKEGTQSRIVGPRKSFSVQLSERLKSLVARFLFVGRTPRAKAALSQRKKERGVIPDLLKDAGTCISRGVFFLPSPSRTSIGIPAGEPSGFRGTTNPIFSTE